MLQAMRQRRQSDEKGFTLIELMVVVLIIAILIAIAIPAFLGARKRAQDRSAQANLRTALSAMETFHSDDNSYTSSVTALKKDEPGIGWVAAITPEAASNSVAVVSEDETGDTVYERVLMSTWSKSGNCYYIRIDDDGVGTDDPLGVEYVSESNADTNADCSITRADALTRWETTAEEGWKADVDLVP